MKELQDAGTPESPEISDAQWREFLAAYFVNSKEQMIRRARQLLNINYYAKQLESKDQGPEETADEVVQNLFLKLQRYNFGSRQKFLEKFKVSNRQISDILIREAVFDYFNEYPVAGPRGKGVEYPHTEDVYQKPGIELVSRNQLDRPDSTNPYVLEEKRELAKEINELLEDILTAREAKVLRMLFGIPPYEREYSQVEIAQNLKIANSNIYEIKVAAFRKIRLHTREERLSRLAKAFKNTKFGK